MERRLYKPTPVLVVNAHPDDESFGFGGTIAKFTQIKRPLVVASLTSGEKGQTAIDLYTHTLDVVRRHEFAEAATLLGLTPDQQWIGTLPDGGLSLIPTQVKMSIEDLVRRIQPGLIMTMHPASTSHPDHIAVAHAVLELKKTKTLRSSAIMLQYLPHKMEPSPDDYHIVVPTHEDLMTKKINAIMAHATQRADAEKIVPKLLPEEHFIYIP